MLPCHYSAEPSKTDMTEQTQRHDKDKTRQTVNISYSCNIIQLVRVQIKDNNRKHRTHGNMTDTNEAWSDGSFDTIFGCCNCRKISRGMD